MGDGGGFVNEWTEKDPFLTIRASGSSVIFFWLLVILETMNKLICSFGFRRI